MFLNEYLESKYHSKLGLGSREKLHTLHQEVHKQWVYREAQQPIFALGAPLAGYLWAGISQCAVDVKNKWKAHSCYL